MANGASTEGQDSPKETKLSPREIKADLDLVRAAIKDHGRTLGDFERQLREMADEISSLRRMYRRNAYSINAIAAKLGIQLETTPSDESQEATQAQPEATPDSATSTTEVPEKIKE